MKVNIYTEHIKLDSFLKLSGAAADGAQAKRLIASGEVMVNGEVCVMRGKKLYPGDNVRICQNVCQEQNVRLLQTDETDSGLYEVCSQN